MFNLCLIPVDKLSRDDEQVQTAPHIHQKCCHQELLREVHQLHPGLYLYLQTGRDRQSETELSSWPLHVLSLNLAILDVLNLSS